MNIYRIGQLAELANVSRRTIDYYTQLGMLNYEKTGSRYRYYTEDALNRLQMINRYKEQNMPLTEIKERLQVLSETTVDSEQVLLLVDKISTDLKGLENELLELKPLLEKLDEQQLTYAAKQLSVRSSSLLSIIAMLA
ncbi:MerR family transcriptional regulator [Peribacillus sp. RS7]|jgi:MerR family copper efflux transcriptional regulator|uniref:MerR family transcriptional regulator n=1 Tax=Peribacillus TaxID=2675229 RepID=UPI0025A1995D|nr:MULTISPECIES: MerR family transcriptional regulator [unclassified Peribacillus]MDM5213691.1 MerR family transcriptional regulator [Peribacillus sp. NJ4]MDM5224061.1 MerR family transcriptional regulator [Peribacillus sp. NJ11]